MLLLKQLALVVIKTGFKSGAKGFNEGESIFVTIAIFGIVVVLDELDIDPVVTSDITSTGSKSKNNRRCKVDIIFAEM